MELNWYETGCFDADRYSNFVKMFEAATEHDLHPGTPEFVQYETGWLDTFMNKTL